VISELDEDTTGVPRPDGGFDLALTERWGIGGGAAATSSPRRCTPSPP
jgi:hypothetical protein